MHTLACSQLRRMELITRGDRADHAPSVRSPHLTPPSSRRLNQKHYCSRQAAKAVS
jgi:hypothetical protein